MSVQIYVLLTLCFRSNYSKKKVLSTQLLAILHVPAGVDM